MKRLFKIITLGCALIGAAGLCSCEREAWNNYAFAVDSGTNVRAETPLDSTGMGTGFSELMDYMRRLGMFEYEDFDNEARTLEDAMRKNDEEAMREFNDRVRRFNREELRDLYKRAGYLSVYGNVNYIMTREDGKLVASQDLSFEFLDLN